MFNLTAELNRQSKTPIYEQLYAAIAEEIRSHGITAGDKLPSKKALASHLGISVNTVETAYAILVQEGYVEPRPRSGYFVQKINAPMSAEGAIAAERPIPKPVYAADFRTNAVDLPSFPYATWVKLSKEVMYANPELLNSGDFKGDFELRESISQYLREFRGVRCMPSQIIIGAGIEYLMLLLTLLLKGKTYAVENPGYGKTEQILRSGGSKINYVALDKDGMCVEDLQRTDSDIAYITPSHQFPTGAVMPIGRRMALLEWVCEGKDRYIIEDDYSGEFNFSVRPFPAVQGLTDCERVIYLSTFSRTLAPSVRIAYMVLPRSLTERYESLFCRYTSTVPRFEQHTLNRFIAEGYFSRHLNRMKNIYKKRCEMLIRILKKYDLKVSGEKAGLHLLAQTKKAAELAAYVLNCGIKLYSLDDYYFTPQKKPSQTLILGYAGCSAEDFERLDRVLHDFFRKN